MTMWIPLGSPRMLAGLLLPQVAVRERSQTSLTPMGPAAERIEALWWVMFWLGTAVTVVVLALLAYALFRRRREEPDTSPEADRLSVLWSLVGGFAVPTVILLGLYLYTMQAYRALEAQERAEPALTVEVIGWRWWWELRYHDARAPGGSFTTANELHLPVGKPVRLLLRSADVIHSFWVPSLHGKTDMIPGRTNDLTLVANEPGIYRGQCAEYCGEQHANMSFLVVAQSQEEFAAWLERERRPAAAPEDALGLRGREVFLAAGCGLCHTVRGTPAGGEVGPDLTHLASRRTLAALTTLNGKGHLGGWIANPQHVKPGNLMPQVPLSNAELLALLHYLQSLR